MAAKKDSGTWYAVSDIKHGSVDEDGKNSFYNVSADEEVDHSKFEDDEWDALVEAGSVTQTPPDEQDELSPEAQVEQSISDVAGAPKASGTQLSAGEKK